MPVIDERGRLFGAVNLIDAVVALVLLGLIPLAYGAFVLFKTPTPLISSIEPAQVVEKKAEAVRILGHDFRPFMHARVGTTEAKAFLLLSPSEGEIKLPELPPGTYDVALYDEGLELVKKAGALTVVAAAPPAAGPPPQEVSLMVVGALVGLPRNPGERFSAGVRLEVAEPEPPPGAPPATTPRKPPVAEILAARAPIPDLQRIRTGQVSGLQTFVAAPVQGFWQVPAILRVTCTFTNAECRVGDTPIAQNAVITLPSSRLRAADDVPPADPAKPSMIVESVKFLIDEVRPLEAKRTFPTIRTAVATLRVRFMVAPEVVDHLKTGELDSPENASTPPEERAVLTGLGSDRQSVTGTHIIDAAQRRNFQIQQTAILLTGTVRVPVTMKADQWTYKDRPIKVGGTYTFDGPSGAAPGWILDMSLARDTERPTR